MSSFPKKQANAAKMIKDGSVQTFRTVLLILHEKLIFRLAHSNNCLWHKSFDSYYHRHSFEALVLAWIWCKERDELSEHENPLDWAQRFALDKFVNFLDPMVHPALEMSKTYLEAIEIYRECLAKLPERSDPQIIAFYMCLQLFEIDPLILSEILDQEPGRNIRGAHAVHNILEELSKREVTDPVE
jgi:hypothetical protein